MSKITFIKRNSAIAYLIVVFGLSWGLILILAGPGNIPINAEQSKELLPLLYTMMLLGPSIAGLLVIGLVEGKKGFRKFSSRLLNWRVNIAWYLAALLATPILATVLLFILSRFNPEFNLSILHSDDKLSLILMGILTSLFVGIFEETGWSGFLVPKLRQRYSILITGLIAGIFWGAWHFILFWESNTFYGTLPFLILLGRLFAWLPPFRVLMVWILDRTDSLIIVILLHASLVFTTTVLVPMTLTGTDLLTWLILWGGILWLVILLIGIFKGRDLNKG